MKSWAKAILASSSLLAGAAGAVTTTFTTAGTASWTVPAGVASITIEVWGGGGGGGGNTTTSDGGGGGGGGAYSRTANIAVLPGAVCTVTIGAGGAGGALLTLWVGGAGGQSQVSCSGGASVSAAGGAGGSPPVLGQGGVGGAGGAAGGGTITFSGGSGGSGRNNNTGRGGPGGSSAGNAANGTSGPATWVTSTAAAPPAGGGIGGDGGAAGGNGLPPASGNGGGGGGSGDKLSLLAANRTGGAGAPGKVAISYTLPPIVTTTAATALLSDGATLNGIVDDGGADTAIAFEYGLTAAYGSTVVAIPSPLPANSGSTAVSAVVSGLACNTTYHFRAAGVNSVGVGYGGDLTFTTTACPPMEYVFSDAICQDGVPFGPPPAPCNLVTWSPRTAGQVLGNIYLTRVSLGVPTREGASATTRDLQFGLSCHDPAAHAGVAARLAYQSPTPSDVPLPLCTGGGASPVPANMSAALSVTFDPNVPSSQYPFSFNYDDVGKVELWIYRSSPTPRQGYTGSFVVKPHHFDLSGIQQTASPNLANPAATDATGAKFVKAGEAFSVTVTVRNALNAVTPNYGREAVAESVKLTPTLAAGLGLTNNPAITGSFGAFGADHPSGSPTGAPGVAHGTAFAWNDVGIITLTPSVADADYLGAGDVTGTASGNVGRFYVAQFGLSAASIVNRSDLCPAATNCPSTFTYMGEKMDSKFTLTAQAVGGATAKNYNYSATPAENFAKLDPTVNGNPLVFGAINSAATPNYLTARLDTSLQAVGNFVNGDGTAVVAAPIGISRGAAADGPYALLDIGIAPVDSDGARMAAYDLDTDATVGNDRSKVARTEVRYGRTRVGNAYGSELLQLVIPVAVQYWNSTSSAYVTSADDSISQFASAALIDHQGNLSAGETTLTMSAVVNGLGRATLTAPGPGNTGRVDLTVNSPSYLPADIGRATFGVYKGSDPFIYMRESY